LITNKVHRFAFAYFCIHCSLALAYHNIVRSWLGTGTVSVKLNEISIKVTFDPGWFVWWFHRLSSLRILSSPVLSSAYWLKVTVWLFAGYAILCLCYACQHTRTSCCNTVFTSCAIGEILSYLHTICSPSVTLKMYFIENKHFFIWVMYAVSTANVLDMSILPAYLCQTGFTYSLPAVWQIKSCDVFLLGNSV